MRVQHKNLEPSETQAVWGSAPGSRALGRQDFQTQQALCIRGSMTRGDLMKLYALNQPLRVVCGRCLIE